MSAPFSIPSVSQIEDPATRATFNSLLSLLAQPVAVSGSVNLTGPITSIGNATSIASQTGTGTTFVMKGNPTILGELLVNASGEWLAAIGSTTQATYMRQSSTGGNLYFGMDSSTASSFGIAGNYGTIISRPLATGFAVARGGVTDLEIDASGNTAVSGALTLAAATTSIPSLNMPIGVAPTAPAEGDFWNGAFGPYFYTNATSVNLAFFQQQGASALLRTFQDKGRDVWSVSDFANVANATAGIVTINSGGTVWFPSGTATTLPSATPLVVYEYNGPENPFYANASATTTHKVGKLFTSAPGTHTDTYKRATVGIATYPVGNTSTAATDTDYGLSIITTKQNWTTTSVVGQVSALNLVARGGHQGAFSAGAGDTSLILGSYTVSSDDFGCILEAQANHSSASLTPDMTMDVQIGLMSKNGGEYIGYYAEAQLGALTNAFAANNVTGLGTWTNFIAFYTDAKARFTLSSAAEMRLWDNNATNKFVGFKPPATVTTSVDYTLPVADGTKGYALHTDGAGVMSWRDSGGISVVVYGADPTGSADSLSSIQAAIDAVGTSGHVYFPPGTYKITNAIRIGSNIKMSGAGYASQISYAGTGGVTVNWVNGGGSGTEYFMVLNENGHQRSGTVDTNIEICHLRFTYTSGTQPHGCFFMNTTDCSVHHCYTDGGPDTCAFLKSKYYRVTNNYNNGCINCAYDNWDGPSHAVIANNVAVVGNGGSGIFVNGVSTDTTTPVNNDGFNIVVANNTIVAGHTGCLQGIYISGLNATSTVKFVAVTGNTIKSDGSNVFTRGIDIREGNYVAVTGNTVVGPCSLNGIEIVSNYNSITGNIVTGVNGVGDYGIEVTGDYNMFSGNVLQGNTANFNDTGTGNQNTSNTAGTNTINIVQ